jgi:hypothetical protein
MTEITDAEAAEIAWANSGQGKAAFKAAWGSLHAMGLHEHVDATQLGQIVYAAHLAVAADPGTVYLATSGAYSDFRVVQAFARREDAESYPLGEEVMEMTVHDGPVEVRTWYTLRWWPTRPDRDEDADWQAAANPWTSVDDRRDYDGDPRHAEHRWLNQSALDGAEPLLMVGGWDLALVKKVYGEQRAQWLARQEGIS